MFQEHKSVSNVWSVQPVPFGFLITFLIPENCDLEVATLMPRGSRIREGAAAPNHVYQSLFRLWWGRGGARRTQAGVSATSPQSLSDIAARGFLGPVKK